MNDSAPDPVRVLLVDDDPMVCTGIALILSSDPGVAVVGVRHNGQEAVEAIGSLQPDVVVMDVRMPVMDGITATARIRELKDAPSVLVLTTFEEDEFVVRSVHAGASGFLLKTANPQQIIAAIRDVASGHGAISPSSIRSLFSYVAGAEGVEQEVPEIERLTPRERDVAKAVWEGHSNATIAQQLYLSETTVKTHLSAIQEKLGASNRVGIAVLVERAGGL